MSWVIEGTIVFTDGKESFSPAIYLHWNGSSESVYPFLEELDRRKIRAAQNYEAARFIQLVGEYFDQETIGGLSLGVVNGPKSTKLCDLEKIQTDLSDNGHYLVQRNCSLKVRRFVSTGEFGGHSILKEMPAEWVDAEKKRPSVIRIITMESGKPSLKSRQAKQLNGNNMAKPNNQAGCSNPLRRQRCGFYMDEGGARSMWIACYH